MNMKKLKHFGVFLLIAALGASCSTDDNGQRKYTGESLLLFGDLNPEKQVYVFSDKEYADTKVAFGTTSSVSGSHSVSLVVDTAQSTAVEGVDFEILTPSVELTDGKGRAEFDIRFFTAPATQAGKKVVFTLASTTLANAGWTQEYTVNVSLTCPVADFVGTFESETWWSGPAQHDIEDLGDNKLVIRGFWSDNAEDSDFEFSYNPENFMVTFADQQTGYLYQAPSSYIVAKQATTAPSFFNPCTRKLTLNIEYVVPGLGTFGVKTEVFDGI